MHLRIAGLSPVLGFLFLVGAQTADAQMWEFPDYAVPSSFGAPSSFVAGTYGRGLNDDSGELDAFGAVVGRTGESVSVMGGLGLVSGGGDDEVTLGGAVGVDVFQGEPATVSLQGGIGWMSPGDVTLLRFPIGVAIKGRAGSSDTRITPWAMPRLNITRLSTDGFSDTVTDFGASAGVSFTFAGGFGVHTALDVLFADGGEPFLFGMGAHYVIE